MLHYVVLFVASFIADSLPVIGPPVWTIMVFMQVKFKLEPWLVLAVGVPASVLGRYTLSLYSGKFFGKVIRQKKADEMRFVGKKLNGSLWRAWLFVTLYSLLPLSTTALFAAAGLARIKPVQILPPFFVGKFISDAIMLFSGRYAVDAALHPGAGVWSGKNIIAMIVGLFLIAAFLFVDWRLVLEKHKIRINFHIWR